MNSWLLLAAAGMQVKATGEALSHPEYAAYVGVTYAVVVVTLIGYGWWLQAKLAREMQEWEDAGKSAESHAPEEEK